VPPQASSTSDMAGIPSCPGSSKGVEVTASGPVRRAPAVPQHGQLADPHADVPFV
jgi:hypothetical protein